MQQVTSAQSDILCYVSYYTAECGYPPTRKEISDSMLYSSANAAQCHLKALENKGLVELVAGVSRGIKLTHEGKRYAKRCCV